MWLVLYRDHLMAVRFNSFLLAKGGPIKIIAPEV